MAFPKSINELANALRQLPQIGPRHAGRLAVFLFRNTDVREAIFKQLENLGKDTMLCDACFRITEKSPCAVCRDKNRDATLLAVVEEDTDVEQLERTRAFHGRYFVLGGRFNPNRGAPETQGLRIPELKTRLAHEGPKLQEVLLATNPTAEGDALALLLMRELKETGVPLTRLGRGLPVGGEIEYADEETLKGALQRRG